MWALKSPVSQEMSNTSVKVFFGTKVWAPLLHLLHPLWVLNWVNVAKMSILAAECDLSKQHTTFKRQVKFKIFFYLAVDILSHVLGNEKVHAYHVPLQKKAAEFYDRLPQTLKNVLNFVVEKAIVSLKFSRITNAIECKRLWSCATVNLYQARPDKPKIIWRYKINMLLIVHEYTLFVCIWSRHFKLYLRKWRLIQMSLKKYSLLITWISTSISISIPILGQGVPIAPR